MKKKREEKKQPQKQWKGGCPQFTMSYNLPVEWRTTPRRLTTSEAEDLLGFRIHPK